MVRIPRAEVDYATEFNLSVDDFAFILEAGGVAIVQSDETPDFHRMFERLLVQYVERATFHWPEYQSLKLELERLKLAASKGHRAFAAACRALDCAVIDPAKDPGTAGHVKLRPAHKEEALDVLEPELVRQLGDHWRAFLDDRRLDLNAIRELLRLQIKEYKDAHGLLGRERQPDLEWFIDQVADLCTAIGINVAANGREREGRKTGTTEYYRGGPFIAVLERTLGIAAVHAAKLGVGLPSTGNLPDLIREVLAKRRMISKQ